MELAAAAMPVPVSRGQHEALNTRTAARPASDIPGSVQRRPGTGLPVGPGTSLETSQSFGARWPLPGSAQLHQTIAVFCPMYSH